RQAGIRRGRGIHLAGGPARRAARARAEVPAADQGRRARLRRGARPQPPGDPRAAAGGRAREGCRMIAPDTLDVAAARPDRQETHDRRLRVVEEPSRRRRPRLVYGVVALVGALTIGAAQMALSIMTTQTSYE